MVDDGSQFTVHSSQCPPAHAYLLSLSAARSMHPLLATASLALRLALLASLSALAAALAVQAAIDPANFASPFIATDLMPAATRTWAWGQALRALPAGSNRLFKGVRRHGPRIRGM
jgi:hypothetical protein